MSKPNLESCYEKVSGLRDQIQEFNYPNCRGLEHSTQIDIQQLVDSVAYTYGLLLSKSPQDNTNLLDAMVKAKNRVLKQYDYDSSTQRKKIFQEALLSITLPSVKAFLAPTFRKELPNFEQYIFDDYVNFINVENVYEDILQQILETDISKVVKEAASMKKYNLFMESRYRFSVSSMYVTPPGSPDYPSTLTKACTVLPSSPLLSHGLMESPSTGEDPIVAKKKSEPEVIMAQQEEVEVPVHAQPELIKVSTSVKADQEHKVEDNEVLEVPASAATETRDRSTTPETLTVHTAVVEEMLVATQSLEENTYSGPPNVVAIDTETLVDPSSSSNTELALKPATHALAEPIPKPVETEANETPVQASPPEGDTGSTDQVSKSETSSSLKFVSAESETERAANISISSAEETAPGVPSSSGVHPLVVEEQNTNTTGDTKVVVDDLTSLEAPIYEVRASNMAQDFSDDSSWTTEEEGDSIEEDDLTTETTSAIPEPEDSVIVKCETISDVSVNVNNNSADPSTEAARPLDCIKEIRALVVEVIEVEEVAQHWPDSGDVSLNTQ
ncbi:hypothetical protein PGIGA_G00095930 [Pangasianodon gigas]|uniref:Uncharacterized protein n=1 Tax=Pangasianodon gigas TaxID=30993 RepID=A0ACC5XDB5_PANGG|nr:hypothetical protein [Pangasianodon gigas]